MLLKLNICKSFKFIFFTNKLFLQTAVSLGTPVMKEEWIHKCWAARNRRSLFRATDDEFLAPCKSKPFEGCKLSFLGFLGESIFNFLSLKIVYLLFIVFILKEA